MSLPRFSVNQSLFVNLLSAIILIIGLIVILGMNREVFPVAALILKITMTLVLAVGQVLDIQI